MRDLALVLWLIGFPLGCALEDYVRTKERGFRRPDTPEEERRNIGIRAVVWIVVSLFLLFRG